MSIIGVSVVVGRIVLNLIAISIVPVKKPSVGLSLGSKKTVCPSDSTAEDMVRQLRRVGAIVEKQ